MAATTLEGHHGMGANPQLEFKYALFIVAFLAMAVSSAVETILKVFKRFRRYAGLYFHAMLVASIGIILHAIGYFLHDLHVVKSVPLEVTLVCGGGIMMITGQSLVLWSRLHVVSYGNRYPWILYMIIAGCVIFQGGATALFTGSNLPHPEGWLRVYAIWEMVQVTWFVIQECIISGIYIYRAFTNMRCSEAFRDDSIKRKFKHLIMVNVIVILLDLIILGLQYSCQYLIQTSLNTYVYSIKLKLEFQILHQLVKSSKHGFTSRIPADLVNIPDFETAGKNLTGGPREATNGRQSQLKNFIQARVNKRRSQARPLHVLDSTFNISLESFEMVAESQEGSSSDISTKT